MRFEILKVAGKYPGYRASRTPVLAAVCALIWISATPVLAADEPATAAPDSEIINPDLAWEKVAQARDAAAEDKHHEAVADYLDALAHDARLVKTVAQEIAYQKLWREDADKAVFYFQRYLARHPGETNREVRKGLALAYSWSGRQREAVALYRQLVDEDPTDGAARIGLGRTLIWNNQLHEGYTVLRGVEDEFPADSPAGRESSRFLLTVLDSYTPHLEIRTEAAWDSDELDIYRVTATGSFKILGNKLLQAIPVWAIYKQPGHADVTAPRLGAGFVGSLAHNWALHAYGWVDRFRSDEPLFGKPERLDWTRPGGDFWVTWLAAPRLRLDFGGSSLPVETLYAFSEHIGFNQGNLSADWRFARSLTLGLSGNYADYSDDNAKKRGLARLTWRREGRWQIFLGPVFTYMDFEDPYPGGYWAPDWVRNGSVELTVQTRSGRWTLRLNGSVGQEKELGADAITVGGGSARVGWRVSGGALLAGEAGYSRSSFSTASGYNRTFASVSFRALF